MADYSRRKTANKKSMRLVIIVMLIFAAVLTVQIIRVSRANKEITIQKTALEQSLAAEESKNEELTEKKYSELTTEEKIALARARFGLVFPNEIIFVPEE